MPDENVAGKLLLDNQLDPQQRFPPKATIKRSGAKLNLSLHHTIPHSRIINCYNALASHILSSKKAVHTLEAFLRLFVSEGEETKVIEGLRSGPLPIAMEHAVHSDLTYAAWNIVEGPVKPWREDDPGDDLDQFLFGVEPSVRAAQEECKKLFLTINAFNEACAGDRGLADEDFVKVQRQVNFSKPVLRRIKSSLEFDPKMWMEIHEPGKPRRPIADARWQKRTR